MKAKLAGTKSSYLVYWPVIIGLFLLCILFFILKVKIVPFILIVVFIVALISRLWSDKSADNIKIKAGFSSAGLFPGQEEIITFEIANDKMLPVMWMDVFCPLNKNHSVLPENTRPLEDWEKNHLKEKELSLEKIAEIKLSSFFWFEKKNVKAAWKAENRGVLCTSEWKIRTGDGFGLGQTELEIPAEYAPDIYVFPKLKNIYADFFVKNVWNARTGMRGIVDDNTVIRSVRDYASYDSIKNINWRLLSRGLPLSVNVYEQTLPQSAFFIFDGESFSGKKPHRAEMEEALSFIASSVCALSKKNIASSLALSYGNYDRTLSLTEAELSPDNKLFCLAAYNPSKEKTDKDNKIIDQHSEFNMEHLISECESAGECYFITYSAENINKNILFPESCRNKIKILSVTGTTAAADYPVFSINDLIKEEDYE